MSFGPQRYIQFNSEQGGNTRFELEDDSQGCIFSLVDKLPANLTVPSSLQERDGPLLSKQPGGPGTHWVGVAAGWHAFVDQLERHLVGPGFAAEHHYGYNRLCNLYDGFLEAHFANSTRL